MERETDLGVSEAKKKITMKYLIVYKNYLIIFSQHIAGRAYYVVDLELAREQRTDFFLQFIYF